MLAIYGGLLFALFLVGWGCAIVWGPVADKFGRVRTLILTILCFSIFTFLAALSTSVWQLASYRFLAGIGIGGEWAMGGTLVAEVWPEERRKMGAGLMHTGYYFGFFLAGILNHFIGEKYGWRAMFAVGGSPAILVGFILHGVHEPERWKAHVDQVRKWSRRCALCYRCSRPSIGAARFSIRFTFWSRSSASGRVRSTFPAGVIEIAGREGLSGALAANFASYATMLLGIGTILGCLVLPPLAERIGRLKAMAAFFFCMMVSIARGFRPDLLS